ncbi:cadherin-like domain-containing protein, partial [Shewanella marisflavi]|uniref:Ig-like domain-containing protein n=1 Tax=Shewanella marisflavi TaxID=260364 RepID=UPI00200D61C9
MPPPDGEWGGSQITVEKLNVNVTINCVNDTPTISYISNKTINEDASTQTVSFTVGDVETSASSLSVSRSTSNSTLLPTSRITLGGSGSNRTVSFTPVANKYGSATITLTASDGVKVGSRSFKVTVNSVNDVPVVSAIANQSTNEDVDKGVSFTISDVETAATSLTISRSSSNTTLLPTANVILGGSGGSRTLTLKPAANQYGTSTVTVNVSDGTATTSRSFVLTVNSVNDAPVVSAIANQSTNEDVNKAVS